MGGRGWGEGAGDISSTLPYTALPQGASPERDFAQSRRHSQSSSGEVPCPVCGHCTTQLTQRTLRRTCGKTQDVNGC